MNPTLATEAPPRLTLQADFAADLMRDNPIAIDQDAPVAEALALFVDRGCGAAPVIDAAGRPVGVVSHTDIIVHERERVRSDAPTEKPARVRDIMTPALFSVPPETPAASVVEQMRALNVQRLFVVNRDGTLVGVIGTLDILGKLRV
jgi:CBS domain-containing protein